MEDDWLYWKSQFGEYIAASLLREHEGMQLDPVDAKFSDLEVAEETAKLRRVYLEPPQLDDPCTLPGRRRLSEKCKASVKLKLPKYQWSKATFSQCNRDRNNWPYLELPLVERIELFDRTKYEKLHTQDPAFLEHDAFEIKRNVQSSSLHSLPKPKIFDPPTFDDEFTLLVENNLGYIRAPTPAPHFPKTYFSLKTPILALAHVPHYLPGKNHQIYEYRPILKAKLKTILMKPAFPKIDPKVKGDAWRLGKVQTLSDPLENVHEEKLQGRQPTIESLEDSMPKPNNIQLIVNRKMLSNTRILSWLESCPKSTIVEREFCESLFVVAISSKACIVLFSEEQDKGGGVEIKEVLELSRRFDKIDIIVDARSFPLWNHRRSLLNNALLITDKSQMEFTMSPISSIGNRLMSGYGTSSICLDPELSAHERLLYHLRGLNHWAAQEQLQQASKSCTIDQLFLNK